MDQGPLVNERIEAGAKFLVAFDKRIPIKLAFWLKTAEGGRWYLYIASEQIDRANRGASYGDLIAAAQKVRDPNLDSFQVKLLGADEPLARGVLDIVGAAADAVPVRVYDRVVGEVSAAEIYVYPVSLPAAN